MSLPDADELVDLAASKVFGDVASYYPGIRAKVPLTLPAVHPRAAARRCSREFFGLQPAALRFTACHFSLVTTPPEKLTYLQRIPHIDSLLGNELAFIHYLFKARLSAARPSTVTARPASNSSTRSAGPNTCAIVEEEKARARQARQPGYINGDTRALRAGGRQHGVFNRMLVYRRNSLHSAASVAETSSPDPNPRPGRLSINGFLA